MRQSFVPSHDGESKFFNTLRHEQAVSNEPYMSQLVHVHDCLEAFGTAFLCERGKLAQALLVHGFGGTSRSYVILGV